MSSPQYLQIDHPWVKHDLLPIYEWVFPAKPDNKELEAFITAREQWAMKAEYPVAWIIELSNLTGATAFQRKLFADHLKRFEPHDTLWNRGSAMVIPNMAIRGLATAVFWMTPAQFPLKSFATRETALVWAKSQLDDSAQSRGE